MVDVFNPNNYINIYKWETKEFYKNYALNFKVNQIKILVNGSINPRV
jgi:hypothetical protein